MRAATCTKRIASLTALRGSRPAACAAAPRKCLCRSLHAPAQQSIFTQPHVPGPGFFHSAAARQARGCPCALA